MPSSMNGVTDLAARYFLLHQLQSDAPMPCFGVRTNSVSLPASASSTARVWFTHRPMPIDITSGSRASTRQATCGFSFGLRSSAISRCDAM